MMGLLGKIIQATTGMKKLVAVKVITDENFNYYVEFQRNDSSARQWEFLRLVLHYYSKMLTLLKDDNVAVTFLLNAMESVLNQGLTKDTNVLENADIADTVTIVQTPPWDGPKDLSGTLWFIDIIKRHVTTELPKNGYCQDMVFAVFAVLDAFIKNNGPDAVKMMESCLSKMQLAYRSGLVDYHKISSIDDVPNAAFVSIITES